MKKIKKYTITAIFGLLLLIVQSCKENADLMMFDVTKSYIYFAVPKVPQGGFNTEYYLDSLNYSFAMDNDEDNNEELLEIPIKVAGKASNMDREVKFEVLSEESNMDMSLVHIGNATIPANKLEGKISIRVKNDESLKLGRYNLYLGLKENENFKIGNDFNKKLRVIISDQLIQPSWWSRWSSVLGPYYFEVYQKWIQIYYLGVDPTPDFYSPELNPGPWYYWDRMPIQANQSLYPITYMYARVLKQYFADNEVYPNGDTSKPRILLP